MTEDKTNVNLTQNWVIILEQFIEFMSTYSE